MQIHIQADLVSDLKSSSGIFPGFYDDGCATFPSNSSKFNLVSSRDECFCLQSYRFQKTCSMKFTFCTGASALGMGIKETRRTILKFTDDRRIAKVVRVASSRKFSTAAVRRKGQSRPVSWSQIFTLRRFFLSRFFVKPFCKGQIAAFDFILFQLSSIVLIFERLKFATNKILVLKHLLVLKIYLPHHH